MFEKLVEKMDIIVPEEEVQLCRDPDDDKFISCALEGKCLYIVSGDKDLLSLGTVDDVEIVTVAEFFKRMM